MAKGRGILKFEIDKCKGCELCVHACPAKILAIDLNVVNKKDYHPVTCTDMSRCIACGSCALMCPDGVISVYKEED
jgi:2-oxoglutarate ferredoxin oxidoreductase subunit delta